MRRFYESNNYNINFLAFAVVMFVTENTVGGDIDDCVYRISHHRRAECK